jgi:hypothetical protein
MLWIRKSRFEIPRCGSATLIFTAALPGDTSYCGTTNNVITLAIYNDLNNAQWSDQYSVHKINTDVHLMCELNVTVKLYRTACSLSDAGWHFLRVRGIPVRADCLMSVPLHNNIYVRMLGYRGENEVGNLREFGLNLSSNSVCVLAWKLRYSQKFGHEIWHKMKRRNIVQTWKRRPGFCLSLAN